jgi:hypothetical protein
MTRAVRPGLVHGVTQCQRVHHGGQHAHVVGSGPVHADRATGHAPEDIATADDDRHLDTHAGDFTDFVHHAHDGVTVDAKLVIAHQGLTRQLEQTRLCAGLASTWESPDRRFNIGPAHRCRDGSPAAVSACLADATCAATSAAKSSTFFSIPSPTTYSVNAFTVVLAALSICSHRLLVVLDERLVEQRDFLEVLLHTAFDALGHDLRRLHRLAGSRGHGRVFGRLGRRDRALALHQFGRHVGAGQGHRLHRRHVHRDVLGSSLVTVESTTTPMRVPCR